MERSKRHFLLSLIAASCFLLAGCDMIHLDFFDGNEKDSNSVVTLAPNKEEDSSSPSEEDEPEDISPTVTEKPDQASPTPSNIQPTKNIELQLYTVNVDSGEIEAETALVPADTKITPDLIVEKVVESMADRSIEVGIEKVSYEGDTVIVSFYKDKAPISDVGAGYEGAILDAIAQSLIDNDKLDKFKKVIYRAEGEAYASGHMELGIDEVYLEEK